MTTRPTAIFLAEVMENDPASKMHHDRAAAELRRLHEENTALRTANETFGQRQAWWNERMFVLEQQRDALLEALNEYGRHHEECLYRRRRGFACNCGFHAAIAAVKGKT